MIRKASQQDVGAIMNFLPLMQAQAVFPYDAAKMVPIIVEAIHDGRVLLMSHGGDVIGSAGYWVGDPFWVSSQKALLDLWVVVAEGLRHSFAAGKLIMAMKQEARRLGIPFMPGVSGSQTYAKTYERHFGPPVAVLFREDY